MNGDRNMTVSDECASVREDFSALLDGELSGEDREIVDNHLSQCSECLRALDGFQRVDGLYGALTAVDAPGHLEDAVREALRPKTRRRAWFKRPPKILLEAAAVLIIVALLASVVRTNMSEVDAPMQMAQLESGAGAVAESVEEERSDAAAEFDLAEAPEAAIAADRAMADETSTLGVQRGETPPSGSRAESLPASPLEEAAEAAPARRNRGRNSIGAEGELMPLRQAAVAARSAARVFQERGDGIHYEAGYENQELKSIARGTAALDDLLDAHPSAREDIERHERIVIRLGETWYSIQPKAD